MFLRLNQTNNGEINLMVGHIIGFGPVASDKEGACNVMLTGNQTVVIDETPRTLRSRIKKAYSDFGATESEGDDTEEAAQTPKESPKTTPATKVTEDTPVTQKTAQEATQATEAPQAQAEAEPAPQPEAVAEG